MKSERKVAQSCPTLSDPIDYSLPGSSIHGIFQARVLEWGAIAFSRILSYIKLILTQCTFINPNSSTVQFSSVAQSCLTLCNPMNCSTPGLPVYHQLLESTQTHVHRVGDAIQPSHPLSSPSPPVLFPRIRVFSDESALLFRWPKYCGKARRFVSCIYIRDEECA